MFSTIVVAADGSPSADLAVAEAKELAQAGQARLVVVHVKEVMAGRLTGARAVHVDEGEVEAKVRGQVEDLKAAGIDAKLTTALAPVGGPAHAIADAAEAEKADLIVTGTRGHTALAQVMLGSVTHRLLHIAPCPLLVVPPKR